MGVNIIETPEEKKARLAKYRDTYRKKRQTKLYRIEMRDLKNSRSQEKDEKLWKLSKNAFFNITGFKNGCSYILHHRNLKFLFYEWYFCTYF
jgi:hypothetical protein